MESNFLKKNNTILLRVIVSFSLIIFAISYCLGNNVPENKGNKRFVFVLFYMASCNHCKRFEPVIKEYVDRTDTRIILYTLDNAILPLFPESISPDQDEVGLFFPQGNPTVPALFIADTQTHKIYPVLHGEASAKQLEARVHQVEELVKQDD